MIGTYFGNGFLKVNYDEFMKVYEITNNAIKAAYSTPAGKGLNKALGNQFRPDVKIIDKVNKKIIVEWIKK